MDPTTVDLISLRQHSFVEFIKLQQEVVASFPVSSISSTVFSPIELFPFLNTHFKEFLDCENLHVILAFIHRCVKMWATEECFSKNDIGALLVDFLGEHEKDECELNVAIQIVYQVLNSTKCCEAQQFNISQKVRRTTYIHS